MTRVSHVYFELASQLHCVPDADVNAALLRELDCVFDKVHQDLFDTSSIAHEYGHCIYQGFV